MNTMLSNIRRDDLLKAELSIRQTLEIDPSDVQARNQLAIVLLMLDRVPEAEAELRLSIAAQSDNADAHANLGNLLMKSDHLPEAEAEIREAIAIEPDCAETRNSLGYLLIKRASPAEAEAELRRALEIRPDYAKARYNLAIALYALRRLDDCLTELKHALAIEPNYVEARNSLAGVLMELNRLPESEAILRQAMALQPDFPVQKVNLSFLLLKLGRYEEAWALHESRYEGTPAMWAQYGLQQGAVRPQWNIQPWRGEPLEGKRLVVVAEQGFGDTIQFARYLPLLKAQGLARLAVVCQPPLARLLEGITGIDRIIPLDTNFQVVGYDAWCFMMSLPFHHGTTLATIPANVPYIKVPLNRRQYWKNRISRAVPPAKLKVGLVWAGNPALGGVLPLWASTYGADRRRSLTVDKLLALLQIPDIAFVSLQKGVPESQLADLPARCRPIDWMNEVGDFLDTAAIIKNLDLVISVDTSVAHLAGALNVPVWILSRFDGCWRWLHDRDDSPWYPSARLFRQREPDNWNHVIEQVAHELAQLAGRLTTNPRGH